MVRTFPAGTRACSSRASQWSAGAVAKTASISLTSSSRCPTRSGLVAKRRSSAAALTLQDLVVASSMCLRAVVTEARHRQDDQSRVELVESFDREAEAVEDSDAEVLQQHVGAAYQLLEQLLVILRLQVEDDGLLVAVAGHEVRRLARHERGAPAAGVVALGTLDLDHACAQVAEHHAAVRSG